MRKKRVTKAKVMRNHFWQRSIERVGYLVDEKELINLIQTQKLKFIEKQSNRVSVFRWISKEGKKFRLVYDKIRHQIITILIEKGEENDNYEGFSSDTSSNDSIC